VNVNDTSKLNTLALLDRLKTDMPEIWSQAQVVGKWVWQEFTIPPLKEVRAKLKELGFHWNAGRKCWHQPCGVCRARSGRDARVVYPVVPATAMELNETPGKPGVITSKEYKVIALRECLLPESMQTCDTPDKAADYWRMNVATCPYFNPDCECFVVLLLNTRRRVKGHQLLTIGTLDTILVHPREVFRSAVIVAAAAIVLMHNLCVAAHKTCYVTPPVMCSARLAGLAILRHSGRKECHGFA